MLLLLLLLNQIKLVINDLFLLFSLSVCSLARVRTTFCDKLVGMTHYKGIFKLKRTNYNDWLNILMSNLTDIRRTSLISLILQTVSRPIIIDIIITI